MKIVIGTKEAEPVVNLSLKENGDGEIYVEATTPESTGWSLLVFEVKNGKLTMKVFTGVSDTYIMTDNVGRITA